MTNFKKVLPPIFCVAILASTSILLQSCSAIYYSANTQNVPLMEEKGDLSIQGGLGFGEETDKIEFNGAYAITDHVGAMFNTCLYNDQSEDINKGSLYEGALGYILSKDERPFIFEAYAGYGIGTGNNTFDDESISFKLNRYFIQPSFGYKSRFIDLAVSVRTAYINYHNVSYVYSSHSNYLSQYPLSNGSNYFVAEPAITMRAGYKFLKLQGQYGWSFNLTDSSFPQDSDHLSIMLSIALKSEYFKN